MLLAAFLLREPLLAPVVTRVVAARLAGAIDGQARVDSAGGGWFSDARLAGIRAESGHGPVRRLRVASVRATYGPGIVRGDLASLRSLTLDGVEATIDLRERGGGGSGMLPPLLELLPTPLPAAGLTGEVRLLLPGREVLLSDLRVTLVGERLSLDVRVQTAEAEPLRVVAEFHRPTADTLRLERAVVLGDATVETFELVLGRARQQLTGGLRLGGGRLTLQADPAKVRATAEGLDLAAIPPSLAALLPSGLGALHGTVAGDASALRSPQGWNVAGSVRVQDLLIAGAGPFALNGQWHLGAGAVHVPRITVSGPRAGEATIAGVVWSSTDRRPHAGTISVSLPDLRGWLPVTLPVTASLRDTVVALTAELAVEGEAFTVTSARLAGAGAELTLRGTVAAAPWRLADADLSLRVDLATLAGVVPDAPNLAGVARLQVTGSVPFTSDPAALLRAPCAARVRGEGVMVGAVAIDGVRLDLQTGDGRVHLTQGEATVAGIGVAATGMATRQDAAWHGSLASLALTFPGVVATTTEPCAFTIAEAGWSAGPLRLASAAGTLSIEASHHADAGVLVVDAPRLDLGQVGLPELGGSASIGIDLRGEWSAPTGHLRLLSDDLRLGTRHARLDLQLSQDQHGIAIRGGRIDTDGDGSVLLSGTLPLRLGSAGITVVPDDGLPAAIDALVPQVNRWLPWIDAGGAQVRLRLGEPQQPHLVTGRLTFSGIRPRALAEVSVGMRQPSLAELDGELDLRGAADGVELALAVRADGEPVLTGSVRSPGAWDARTLAGGWRQRGVTGELVMADLQLTRLAASLPGVQHLAGRANGRLAFSGSAAEPLWSGTLELDAVEAKFTSDVPTLADGRVQLELVGRTVHLRQGGFDLGGAPVTVAGELELGEPPRLSLRLDGDNALLVQRPDARVRADLGLALSGPLDQLTVSGRAVVTSALFSPDLSLWQGGAGRGDGRLVPFEFVTPPLSTLRFDVQVSSAFTSAQDGVRVVTSLVRADCDLDLHLGGSGAAPELVGRVVVRQGHVFLPFSKLRLSTGEVWFPEGDPFHPRLNAVATAQVRRWRVTLQADGPLADPQVRASGDGLDERDALLLLTTGSTSAELSGEEGQRAALGRLGTWLGREAWDLLDGESDPDAAPGLVDRLTLEFGRQVSDGGKDTIEAQVELTEPETNPGVLLFGERDRWEDYNAGLILRFRWGGEE